MNGLNLAAIVLAYAVGSLSPGLWLAKRNHVSLREAGSGSTGATNVGRVLGKRAGRIVLALDVLKGSLIVLLAKKLSLPANIIQMCAFAVVFGHCFPLWHRLRGGKGVATTLGAMLFIDPQPTCIAVLAYALLRRASPFASVRSIGAISCMTACAAYENDAVILAFSLWLLTLYMHRENIRRLYTGSELASDSSAM